MPSTVINVTSNNDDIKITYPKQRLAALTRVKNYIKTTLDAEFTEVEEIKNLLKEYYNKLTNFDKECNGILGNESYSGEDLERFKEWYGQHKENAIVFIHEVENWITQQTVQDEIRPEDSASNTSRGSSSSKGSKTSSLKIRIAEERARRRAKEAVSENKQSIERQQLDHEKQQLDHEQTIKKQQLVAKEKRLALQHAMEKVVIKESQQFEENLLKEIEAIDNDRSVSGAGSTKHKIITRPSADPRNKQPINMNSEFLCNNDQQTGSKINNDGLTEVLKRQNEISLLLLKSQEKSWLPKCEPENFDGTDLTKYKSFMQSFKNMIDDKCDNDLDRLFLLEKYTSGLPLQLIKGCRKEDPESGFGLALENLQQKFGCEWMISNAYIEKLNNWKAIEKYESGKELQQLSIFLLSCKNMMNENSSFDQLNNPTEIMKIVSKLPFKMRDNWRSCVQHIYLDEKRLVKFLDLCKFVERHSDRVNLPIFGKISDDKGKKTTKEPNRLSNTKKTVFTTTTEKQKKDSSNESCICCLKDNHSLAKCYFFKRKSLEDRLSFVKDKRLCLACLGKGHWANRCNTKSKCDICSQTHPTILHREGSFSKKDEKSVLGQTSEPENKNETTKAQATNNASTTALVSNYSGAGSRTVAPAVPVKIRVKGCNQMITTYLGMDTYCSDVFMDKELLTQLGVRGQETNIAITTINHVKQNTNTLVINNLEIFDLDENVCVEIPVVFCKSSWPFTKSDSPQPSDLDNAPHLKEIPFNFIDEKIGLLVGRNMPQILRPEKIIKGPSELDSFATLHKFGWSFTGPVSSCRDGSATCYNIKVEESDVVSQFQQLCATEFQDTEAGLLGPSVEDQQWDQIVRSSLNKLPDGHFEVALPFREKSFIFPNNRDQVFKRLMSLKRRLQHDNRVHHEYDDFMKLMLERKFAERIPEDQLKTTYGKVWYLCHFAVYHKQKKKIRIVFDASLKYKGVSLNTTLLSGPDLANNLLGVLLRFREGTVAATADIEKMFYMVKVPNHQKDYLRFLWFPDGNLQKDPIEYRVTVHIFGAVSSPSVANFVLRHVTEMEEGKVFDQEVKTTVKKIFYVDDLLKSSCSENNLSVILQQIRELVKLAGFNLTAFSSNSREVLRSIPQEDLAKNLKELDFQFEELPLEKALGVYWNVENDYFGFKLNLPEREFTRRGVLSTTFSLYDPFGMAGPATLPAKRIFQLSCHDGLQWDDPLTPALAKEWRNWLENIPKLSQLRIPRCLITSGNITKYQLHFFCDGSEVAYAAVAYLRSIYSDGNINCSFVMAKSRLVPIRGTALITIPRVEWCQTCNHFATNNFKANRNKN